MPYIPIKRREMLAMYMEADTPKTPGELNFIFTVIAKTYLEEHGLNYQSLNDIMGALEGAKLEMYRRVAAPYEDEAIERNGDV